MALQVPNHDIPHALVLIDYIVPRPSGTAIPIQTMCRAEPLRLQPPRRCDLPGAKPTVPPLT